LRPGEALLEYSVGARESFAWVVTREGITGTRITGRAADWQPTGLSKYKKIYVAPDGELYGVGFAGKMPAEWPGALAIVPSGKALTLLKAPAKLAGRRVVVFADPLYEAGATAGSGLRFPRLRFSAMEAAAISRIWGRQVAQRLGAEASREALLRTKWEGVGLAHIAAHADFDSLVLSLYDGTGRALDGQLRMEDVAAMRLDKALVVLSACGTAAGKSLRGEGPMSLARAFLGAGAAGVVATLWPVDDAASARLMEAFHEGLKLKGLGPAEALRQAQMAVRREARWESPHYWAGWVYVGR
jgi:CHAT domain-containing protein